MHQRNGSSELGDLDLRVAWELVWLRFPGPHRNPWLLTLEICIFSQVPQWLSKRTEGPRPLESRFRSPDCKTWAWEGEERTVWSINICRTERSSLPIVLFLFLIGQDIQVDSELIVSHTIWNALIQSCFLKFSDGCRKPLIFWLNPYMSVVSAGTWSHFHSNLILGR